MSGNLRRSRALGAAGTLLVRSVELNAGHFPDDEAHVAAYLNARYYTFKP